MKYDPYDPYKKEMKNDGKSGSNYLVANCDSSNSVVIDLNQEQTQEVVSAIDDSKDSAAEPSTLKAQELMPQEALEALNGNSNGNGEPSLDINKNLVNICSINNNVEMTTDLPGSQAGSASNQNTNEDDQNLNEGNQAGVDVGSALP